MSVPTVSVVIPTFNESTWLPRTLKALRIALAKSPWPDAEIVVVDDGSTDDTVRVLAQDSEKPALVVVHQPNRGRFAARLAGLLTATGEFAVLLDSRVFPDPDSLAFLGEQLVAHPDRLVWNAHVEVDTIGNRFAGFWSVIVKIAWRRYFREPRTMSYGDAEYDWYPKGTTYFAAPRDWLLEACESFDSLYADPSKANDDTLLIRPLVRRARINISPSFGCTYHSRDSWSKFLRHCFHRGTVFVDGYYRPGSRFHRLIQLGLLAPPLGLLLLARRPRTTLLALATTPLGAFVAARRCGANRHEASSFSLLALPFVMSYGAGILRGLAMAVCSRCNRVNRP